MSISSITCLKFPDFILPQSKDQYINLAPWQEIFNKWLNISST